MSRASPRSTKPGHGLTRLQRRDSGTYRQYRTQRPRVVGDLAQVAADRVRVTDEVKTGGLRRTPRRVEARMSVRVKNAQVADHRFQARAVSGRGDNGVRRQAARPADHFAAFEARDPGHHFDASRLELGEETDID